MIIYRSRFSIPGFNRLRLFILTGEVQEKRLQHREEAEGSIHQYKGPHDLRAWQ
jgi:hypothetical protein